MIHILSSCLMLALTSTPLISARAVGGEGPLRAVVDVEGTPVDDVSCPVPLKSGSFQYFTKDYVKNNIETMVTKGGKKGSYPAVWKADNDHADQFDWSLNDCQKKKDAGTDILELPMFISPKTQKETYWTENDNNNKPGPYREYYVLTNNPAEAGTDKTATYCGAYAHKDEKSNGDWAKCT